MNIELTQAATGAQGSQAFYIFQTGLTGSTGYVLYFNPVHPVILSRINKPQMNADKRRLIASVHLKGRQERKAEKHKSLHPYKIIRPGTRMTRIGRIYTDNEIRAHLCHPCNPCSIVFEQVTEISNLWHFSLIIEKGAAQ